MKEQDINVARALYYRIFGHFFVYTSDINRYFELIDLLKALKENSLDENSSKAFENIYNRLQKDTNKKLLQEYDDIFHNPLTTTVRTTASFYDEGVESGQKRVRMIEFLGKTKIRRDEKKFFEYEDSLGFIFVVLSQLANLVGNGENEYKNLQHCIFNEILNEFVDEISKEIYEHEKADIYKNVIVALLSFMEFERLYFGVTRVELKPKIDTSKNNEEETISQEEMDRRARNKLAREQGPKKQEEEPFVASVAEDI